MTKLSDKIKAKEASKATQPHLVITARAGTGKTTTLVEGLKQLRGEKSRFDPSPQQRAIWESICLSPASASACFVAFNKAIASELQARVPQGVDAMTMHSLGLKAVKLAFDAKLKISDDRVTEVLCSLMGTDPRELRRYHFPLIKAVEALVGLCKNNLLEGTHEELSSLMSSYDIEMECSQDKAFGLVPQVLERCKDVDQDRTIDFDDMVWLPVVLGLKVPRYELLLVDEAQDLNRCQQELAKKAGHRLIFCGDDKQAIYGFAGADSQSLSRLVGDLGKTAQGCINLPLTVTRRCGKEIVKEAQKLVPDFEAHEDNGFGEVRTLSFTQGSELDYRQIVKAGDMILCRTNAPLVSECFRFLRAGKKANIQGKDIGAGLVRQIDKLGAISVPDLVSRLSDWKHAETEKELAKRIPSDSRMINIQDKYDCLVCFTENMKTVDDVRCRIKVVFTDDKTEGIKLASIHKAKGLEAYRVFILYPKGVQIPHPMAKTAAAKEQEWNLLYVAQTRAIEELIYVREGHDKS